MALIEQFLPPGKQPLYKSLRSAGLTDAVPQRNVEWIMLASDGTSILNWWRRGISERDGWVLATVDARNWVSRSPAQERKRQNVVTRLTSLDGQAIRVSVLESTRRVNNRHAGTRFDDGALWLVEDTRKDFLLWRGREPEDLHEPLPSNPRGYGNVLPNRRESVSSRIERDGRVVGFTLRRAGNKCELPSCVDSADFVRPDVHHVVALGERGSDHTDNTIALCPACHVRVHRGSNAVIIDIQNRINTVIASRG